jgi:hypothetical protein
MNSCEHILCEIIFLDVCMCYFRGVLYAKDYNLVMHAPTDLHAEPRRDQAHAELQVEGIRQ